MDPKILKKFKEYGVGTVARALIGTLGYRPYKVLMETRIKNYTPGLSMAGPAVTVKYRTSRDPPKHEDYNITNDAVNAAEKGSVFVLDGEGRCNVFFYGDIMAHGLVASGFVGAIIDGGIHDVPALKEMGFPSFAPCVGPRPSSNAMRPIAGNVTIQCGGVQVDPGDIIVGDDDGVVVCPKDKVNEVLEACEAIAKKEHDKIARYKKGATFQV